MQNSDDYKNTESFVEQMKKASTDDEMDRLVTSWVNSLSFDSAYQIRTNISANKDIEGKLSNLVLAKINARFGK